MEPVSRRSVLAAAAAGTVATAAARATFGNPDEPPQGAINTIGNPSSVTDPGPQNPAIASQFPAAFSPPPTNVGDMPMFWASFNNAPRRIQNGGWARQVTQADFAISEEISGVNMRLTRGGIRELHWHQAAEWAYVSKGAIRITTIDSAGRSNVEDVSKAGCGISRRACRIRCRASARTAANSSSASTTARRRSTTRSSSTSGSRTRRRTYWRSISASGRDVCEDPAARPLHLPGPDAGPAGAGPGAGGGHRRPHAELLDASSSPAWRRPARPQGGEARVADSRNFKASLTIAAALVTVHPAACARCTGIPMPTSGSTTSPARAR